MRISRSVLMVCCGVLACLMLAGVALWLVPGAPVGQDRISTTQNSITENRGQVATAQIPLTPQFGPNDFPALASVAPLGTDAVIGALDLLPPDEQPTLPEVSVPQGSGPEASIPESVFRLPPGDKPLIAIVIDDLGPNARESRRAIRLPAPVTFAILPYADDVAQLAAQARDRGHELIVHVPMQPLSPSQNPGPNALLTTLDAAEIQRRVVWNLSQFRGFVGINNHMGSRFTADANGMNVVMEELSTRGLFFLDSRTIGRTAARVTAARHRVPLLERDVFLDDTDTAAAVAAQLRQTLAVARRRGRVIAIGHPRPHTLDALERWLPEVAAEGYQLVTLSRILAATTPPAARADVAADAAR